MKKISKTLAVLGGIGLAGALFAQCSDSLQLGDTGSSPMRAAEGVRDNILPRLPVQDAALIDARAQSEGLLPLRRENTPFLDIRGLGDSAFTGNQAARAPAAAFGAALDRFNANGLVYRGDLNVINWETVVGESCRSYGGGFGFLTSPAAITQAFLKGIQVFSLSNNHSRDCNSTPEAGSVGDGGAGEITTVRNMSELAKKHELVWNGISSSSAKSFVTIRQLSDGQQQYRLAFASIDLGRDSCSRSNCFADRSKVAAAVKAADADIKIVSFHAREWLSGLSNAENRAQLDKVMAASKLFIEQGGADIVFGTGPHIAMPVRVLPKAGGGVGVAFLSLGNFIHPLLSAQSPNLVGRVLFDLQRRVPVQVQAMMVSTDGPNARPINFNASSPFVGGAPWRVAQDQATGLAVGFMNIKQ
jgi:hypothetical protein